MRRDQAGDQPGAGAGVQHRIRWLRLCIRDEIGGQRRQKGNDLALDAVRRLVEPRGNDPRPVTTGHSGRPPFRRLGDQMIDHGEQGLTLSSTLPQRPVVNA